MAVNGRNNQQSAEASAFIVDAQRVLSRALTDDRLIAGLHQEGVTKHGQLLKVSQYLLGDARLRVPVTSDYAHEESVFIAQDQSAAVVGFKSTQLKRPFESIRAVGYVASAIGGIGIASALERANQTYLQTVADRLQEPVVQIVSNANHDELQLLMANGAPAEEIERKQIEQQRWRSLYSGSGNLGIDDRGRKVFMPRDGDYDFIAEPTADPAVLMSRLYDEIIPQLQIPSR